MKMDDPLEPDAQKSASFLCWDLAFVGEVLSRTRHHPIVYGLTIDGLLQGLLPAHPRIAGYFSDAPFLRMILTSCGIPLAEQFSLAGWLDPMFSLRRSVSPAKEVAFCSSEMTRA